MGIKIKWNVGLNKECGLLFLFGLIISVLLVLFFDGITAAIKTVLAPLIIYIIAITCEIVRHFKNK